MNLLRDVRIRRLRYRAWHRGCKETDVILGRFCDAHLDAMEDAQLDTFEAMLDEDDHDIWQWVAYGAPVPRQDYAPIVTALREMKVDAC